MLSTCNRVEVYAEVDKFHGGLAEASELLARHAGVDLDELTPHLYVHYEDRAVVAPVLGGLRAGLDGRRREPDARPGPGRRCAPRRTPGRPAAQLGALVQQALRVGKRARTETGIDRAGRSLVTAGLDEAGQRARRRWTAPRCSSSAPVR